MITNINHTYRFYKRVLENSVAKFLKEDVLTQSAALSFYMIFSWPSILLIIIWTASRFYREVAVRDALFSEIGEIVGHQGAQQLIATVEKIDLNEPTWWATGIGIGVMLFTATTVLATVQSTLNRIYEVKPAETQGLGILEILRERFISFTLIVTISFLLLVSLVVDTLISAFGEFAVKWLGGFSSYIIVFDAFLLELAATTVVFALFIRYLPDIKLKWKDTWLGALVTASFFGIGKYLIGFLIGSSDVADIYDAAGSVLVLMLWVYYASAIFLFGATFTFERAQMLCEGVQCKSFVSRIRT
jgi:membrane protein